MPINEAFIAELEMESKATNKILERIPIEKPDWKPHAKSTPIGRLSTHVAELPGWTTMTLTTSELDFTKMDYKPSSAKTTSELLEIFEKNSAKAKDSLKNAKDADFAEPWTLRNGEQVFFTLPKIQVIRMSFNHLYHHRAQLTVYLRLLDVPLPGIYGPTADEPVF